MSCTVRHLRQFEFLELLARAKRPLNLFTQHNCTKDVLSHKYFQWHDTSIDLITDKSLTIAEGEIVTHDPESVARRINEITSRGSHSLKAKPCNVTEIHEHKGAHHVHFTCRLPYPDIDDMSNLLSDLIDINKPF